jgi:predicted methyltransferase
MIPADRSASSSTLLGTALVSAASAIARHKSTAFMSEPIDLRAAMNAISDVVQNRPRPLREFDQIYMKTGDMVMQSEFVAKWAHDKRLAFIGDGDAISVCVAYLQKRGIIDYGPSKITVFDFDERIVGAVKRFADKERLEHLDAMLYNCLDSFPSTNRFDRFYTNPPWGASNNGESVKVFTQRGMEAIGHDGHGMIVIADDEELEWPKNVLANVQRFTIEQGFFVARMMPRLHLYHLDDAPDLKSCNLIVASIPGNARNPASEAITNPERLRNFYGQSGSPRVKYVRERKRLDYGKAYEDEYQIELLEDCQ